MQPIKIFLASSGELRAERDGVFKIVAEVNKLHPHLHLEIVEWETDLPSGNYDGKRIQDEINPLLCQCQLTYVLFYSKAGQFTIEELNLAQQVCPKVFVYFKTGFSTTDRAKNKMYDEVLEIREQLDKANQLIFKDYDDLTRFELHFKDDLHKHLHQKFPPSAGATSSRPDTPTPPRTDIYHLPDPQPHFTGREAELQLLDEAWADPAAALVQFIAPGGTGKTQLITYWVHRNVGRVLNPSDVLSDASSDASLSQNVGRAPNPSDVNSIYAWSFYSQGSDEGRQASSDLFFDHAARFFGIAALPTDPRERGRTLAQRLKTERCLLILDGIEPLQYPSNAPGGLAGRLKDPALAALLRDLSLGQPGLCLLSTRIAVTELEGIAEPQHRRCLLENFDEKEGAFFLQKLGVRGSQTEREAAAREYRGHALALRLLGNYVVDMLGGDLRQRDRIPHLSDEEQAGGHARRVMQAYADWFVNAGATSAWGTSAGATLSRPGTKTTPPELLLLHMMGLFDRPAPVEALDALCAPPTIEGLTDGLQGLSAQQIQRAFNHLKKLGLLEENRLRANQLPKNLPHLPALRDLESLDAHPLVREHFGQKMEAEQPDAWREANTRLYHFYKNLPEKPLPDTLPEMEPLFLAMAFGCRAGLQQEVLDEVYWERIRRKSEAYSVHKLGAFGSDLAALAHLFEQVWERPSRNMTEAGQTVVLSWAGFGLRGLGRLREAAEPTGASLELSKSQNDWKNTAIDASNLSQLHLTLGSVQQAVAYAQQAVEYADLSGDAFWKEASRTTLADALLQSGELEAARHWFAEAEAMQRERQPEYRFLYSVRGFLYCELLLGLGKWAEVLERAECFFQWRMESDSLLEIALENLSYARAHAQAYETEPSDAHREAAEKYLNLAVEGLRKAGHLEFVARGLLTRADWHLRTQRPAEAAQDLEEVYEIAESGSMGLYLVDWHIAMARLRRLEGKAEEAVFHQKEALRRVEETRYGRRRAEVEGL